MILAVKLKNAITRHANEMKLSFSIHNITVNG